MRTSGDRFDYSSERARHENFVGRTGLLARLDQLLVEDAADRWVVITGGPGMGKSALLAAWLARRVVDGAVVPHHFIRRGLYDWDDPAKLVGSLVAQIEDGFPELREPEADERMHPAMRLSRALSRVSEQVLVPRGARLVVLIDGLDEYDPPPERSAGDPLAAFLPDTLPAGVRLLCASRPRHPYVSSLYARDCELVQIDLDDPGHAVDNEATVRAFWTRAAEPLHLDAGFVDEAVARAGGNVQHAVQLRKRLAVLPPEQRRVEDIPRGLAALIEKAWARVAVDPAVVAGLGILCAAREALTLDEIGAVADWGGDPQRRTWVRSAKELLVETPRPGGQLEYRLHHDAIRGYVAQTIGDDALRAHHRALARRYATWPAPGPGDARRYALRHALIHRAEAGDWADAWRLAGDMRFVEAKCRELGVHEAEVDVARAAERCRVSDDADAAIARRLGDLARALGRESHWLSVAPDAAAGLVWNRLRRSGWPADELDEQLRGVDDAGFLRVRHAVTRESPALVRDLVGHASWVNACAVTPDGRRVVSASQDRTLKVWDLETGRPLATLEGHASWVLACAVTPDGRRVVSASLNETLKVWDLETGRPLATLEGHASWVLACAVTPDGRRVVSASHDKTLKVWDLETGRPLVTLKGHADSVNACAVTPDGRRVVSASDDKTLKVWDLETGRPLVTLKGHADSVNACAVTPDGRRVVSASHDKTLKVWDLETGRPLATLEGHAGWVRACAVTPDGRCVVSASLDNTLKVWDLQTGRPLATLKGHAGDVMACAVTPDGRRVVSASDDNTLKVWDLETGHPLTTLEGHADWERACPVMPDGRRVVSASTDGTTQVWDLETRHPLATLEGHAGWVNACAVTPDDRRVVSASWDWTLRVWDLETGRPLATLEGHAGDVMACAVTPDGRRVVSASEDRTLKVWDLETGRPLVTLEGHADRVTACAVTLDGQRVVSASHDKTLKVWDLETGCPLATLEGHGHWVTACAVTPDGRRVVSASHDKTLKVWDLETGRPLATLEGHADGVRACAVTPDGRRVVSASDDRTLKVWDIQTCTCLVTHRGDAPYDVVATSATAIVAGDVTGGLWFLDAPPSHRPTTPDRVSGRDDRPRRSDRPHVPLSPRPLMTKHTILFLAANPLGTDWLALDREAHAIQAELERSGHRERFELVTRWAAQPLDLLRELRKLRPSVVHFSGHGGHAAPDAPRTGEPSRRDVVTAPGAPGGEHDGGLFFEGPDGRAQRVSTAALSDTFRAAGASVKLVVLNACYSEPQAEALAAHVDCVVGMGGSISDDTARSFAIGFYGGLGERESVAVAYDQGCAAIGLEGEGEADRPRLKTRSGVDAMQLVLAAESQASPAAAGPTSPSTARTAPTSSTPRVDIGIVTIRDDEFRAVLDVFPSEAGIAEGKHRKYALRRAEAGNGQHYTIAVLRQVEKGQGEAQAAARDLIDDLAPKLVLVVGIAGGLPSDDVKLGDVVLSTRIQDFTVEARKYGKKTTYAVTGGAVVTSLAADVAILEARKSELGDWTAGLPPQPAVTWTRKNQLYGPSAWRSELRAKLEHHYGEAATPRAPRFMAGPIASSDRLVKDPELVIPWLATSRDLLAIEMESGGVYRASQDRCPMLAIRGISDIVGLKRADAWTKYACASAAAFTRGFLRTRPIKLATAATGTVAPSDHSSKADPAQARHDRQASSPETEDRPMTHEDLLTRLSELLPSQFEEVLYRAKIPPRHLPGASAAQTARAIEALRYIEQQKQLEELARIVSQVLDPR